MGEISRKREGLTDYESQQADKIAAWKSAFPNPLGELFRRAALPLAKAAEAVIPDRVATLAIETIFKASDRAATADDIKRKAGVNDISQLRHESLETCDRLSQRVGTFAQGLATVEGALTGAGGIWTTLLDVPLLFGLCLRTIIKTGHCYGYPLDQPSDNAWILGAFAVAISNTKERRTELTERLREIEDLLLEETQEQIVIEESAALITQIEVFEDIPVFGAATGALLNFSVARKTAATAQHLFQERWLRDNGKIQEIDPAPTDADIPSTKGWAGAIARTGYAVVHSVSFGAAFPVYFAAAIFMPAAIRPDDDRAVKMERQPKTA